MPEGQGLFCFARIAPRAFDSLHMSNDGKLDRRELLLGAAGAAAASVVPAAAGAEDVARDAEASDNPIVRENRLPGTDEWQLTYVHPNAGDGSRTKFVEGYCSHT